MPRRPARCPRDVIDRLIVRHEGRIFGSGGDSVLAAFGSAVEAVPADEILAAIAVTDSGRPFPRVGGLTTDEMTGEDGLR